MANENSPNIASSDIDKIIALISPRYLDISSSSKKRELLDKAKTDFMGAMKDAKVAPGVEYKLLYDSPSEQLEPLYFWILDFMNDNLYDGKVEKLIDNFSSSPGSGYFSEIGTKASQMQQEASRVLGTVNNILKGILNLIYDLKEFKLRLSQYDAAKSSDKNISEAGILSLKQVWMDKVDMQRGAGSINALSSGDLNFVTLRDAFLSARSIDQIEKELDLNDRVKRILKPRLQEFLEWKVRSHEELKKRFEIEKAYLKSQVAALKLNTRWARPYLRAAQQLSTNERLSRDASLVTSFNTILMELTIMGSSGIKISDKIISKELPRSFERMKIRKYNSVVLIDLKYRGIPSKAGQHYTFGGRVDVYFRSYCLNDEEIKMVKKKLEDTDVNYAFQLIEGMTKESLDQLDLDLKELLGDENKKEDEIIDPFTAFFSIFKKSLEKKDVKKDDKKKEEDKIKRDSYAEEYIRNLGDAAAINNCFTIYDIYKKSHGMAAFPYREDSTYVAPKSRAQRFFRL